MDKRGVSSKDKREIIKVLLDEDDGIEEEDWGDDEWDDFDDDDW